MQAIQFGQGLKPANAFFQGVHHRATPAPIQFGEQGDSIDIRFGISAQRAIVTRNEGQPTVVQNGHYHGVGSTQKPEPQLVLNGVKSASSFVAGELTIAPYGERPGSITGDCTADTIAIQGGTVRGQDIITPVVTGQLKTGHLLLKNGQFTDGTLTSDWRRIQTQNVTIQNASLTRDDYLELAPPVVPESEEQPAPGDYTYNMTIENARVQAKGLGVTRNVNRYIGDSTFGGELTINSSEVNVADYIQTFDRIKITNSEVSAKELGYHGQVVLDNVTLTSPDAQSGPNLTGENIQLRNETTVGDVTLRVGEPPHPTRDPHRRIVLDHAERGQLTASKSTMGDITIGAESQNSLWTLRTGSTSGELSYPKVPMSVTLSHSTAGRISTRPLAGAHQGTPDQLDLTLQDSTVDSIEITEVAFPKANFGRPHRIYLKGDTVVKGDLIINTPSKNQPSSMPTELYIDASVDLPDDRIKGNVSIYRQQPQPDVTVTYHDGEPANEVYHRRSTSANAQN